MQNSDMLNFVSDQNWLDQFLNFLIEKLQNEIREQSKSLTLSNISKKLLKNIIEGSINLKDKLILLEYIFDQLCLRGHVDALQSLQVLYMLKGRIP
jgi:hypothetical protein